MHLTEENISAKTLRPVQPPQRETSADLPEKPKPVKPKVERVKQPVKGVTQKEILRPTVVQKRESPRQQKQSERQDRVRELKEQLAAITEGEKQPTQETAEEAALVSSNVTPTLEVSNFPFPQYLLNTEKKLKRSWSPPPLGTVGEIQETVVAFRVGRDGKVSEVHVERDSGNSYFDLAALRAVYDADPLPPLPRDYLEGSLLIHVSFLLNRNL
jgi:protein TonB